MISLTVNLIRKQLVLLALIVTIASCVAKKTKSNSIGVAKMLVDRTIVMNIRASSEEGSPLIGDASFVYEINDPEYNNILNHLDGLEPGQTKFVPAWRD